jgi:hypothetical protein
MAEALARGLEPPTTRCISCDSSSYQARGLDAIRHSAWFHRQLSRFEAGRWKTTQKILIQEAFEDLSREDDCLTIILGILFQNKGFSKF